MTDNNNICKYYKCDIHRVMTRYYKDRVESIRNEIIEIKPKRNRSALISPFMISIISIIHYLEEEGKKIGLKLGKDFLGISESDIERWFSPNASVSTIRNNLYKLSRFGFLLREKFGGTFYYMVNDVDFICKNGVYLYKYGDAPILENIFLGYCGICHYCNYKPDKCMFDVIFKKKLSNISDIPENDIDSLPMYKELKRRVDEKKKIYEMRRQTIAKLKKFQIPTKTLTEYELYRFGKIIDRGGEEEKIEKMVKKEYTRMKERRKPTQEKRMSEKYEELTKYIENLNIIGDEWGFNLIMMGIINIINLGREDAKSLKIQFPGFSLYQIKQMLKGLWLSSEMVYDNLYKLQKMGVIRKLQYSEKEMHKSKSNYYFDLNDNRFLCIGGIYLFYYPNALNEYKIFNGVCPHYHFCNASSPSSCQLFRSFQTLSEYIGNKDSHLLRYLSEKMELWKNDFINFDIYKENLMTIIAYNVHYIKSWMVKRFKDKGVTLDNIPEYTIEYLFNHLTASEIMFYGKEITEHYDDERLFKSLFDEVCEAIFVSVYNQYKKEHKEAENSNDTKSGTTLRDILKTLLTSNIEEKIKL